MRNLNQNEMDAINAANAPSTANPFATVADASGGIVNPDPTNADVVRHVLYGLGGAGTTVFDGSKYTKGDCVTFIAYSGGQYYIDFGAAYLGRYGDPFTWNKNCIGFSGTEDGTSVTVMEYDGNNDWYVISSYGATIALTDAPA